MQTAYHWCLQQIPHFSHRLTFKDEENIVLCIAGTTNTSQTIWILFENLKPRSHFPTNKGSTVCFLDALGEYHYFMRWNVCVNSQTQAPLYLFFVSISCKQHNRLFPELSVGTYRCQSKWFSFDKCFLFFWKKERLSVGYDSEFTVLHVISHKFVTQSWKTSVGD